VLIARWSRQDFLDDMTVGVGQAAIEAVVADGEPGVVDAQLVQELSAQCGDLS
jgi:hypothetical protein